MRFVTKSFIQQQNENYFILQEILSSFKRRNFLAVNASISFFALFAFIPLILLILFFFSQWLSSSLLSLEKLQNITIAVVTVVIKQSTNTSYQFSVDSFTSSTAWY